MRTTSRALHIQVNVYIGKVQMNLSTGYFKKMGFQILFEDNMMFFVFMSNGNEFLILGPAAEKDDLMVCVFLQKSEFIYSALDDLNGFS